MAFDGLPRGVTAPPAPISADTPENDRTLNAPGTMVLVFVFLAAFVLYYFVNWKLLSAIWRIG